MLKMPVKRKSCTVAKSPVPQLIRFSWRIFWQMFIDHCQVRLPEVVSSVLADPDKFRDLYRFTYKVSDDDGEN